MPLTFEVQLVVNAAECTEDDMETIHVAAAWSVAMYITILPAVDRMAIPPTR